MRVVVVGAGIAGLTAALAFDRIGADVVVIERAPGLRDEGYMVDFFGPGFDAAEDMGLLGKVGGIHRQIPRLEFVDGQGSARFGISYPVLRRRAFADRHFNFMRGDLEHLLHDEVHDRVDVRFGVAPVGIEPTADGVEARLDDGSVETADLLLGADGAHSWTRDAVFDADTEVLDLGHATAAYILDHVPSGVTSEAFVTLNAPGRMAALYPFGTDRAATFFVHRTPVGAPLPSDGAGAELRRRYGDLGWVIPDLLADLPADDDIYFDRVFQVRRPSWVNGRVVLVGDSAWCVSLLAGQGASMAMAGAHRLAQAVDRDGLDDGPRIWERDFRPTVLETQERGRQTANWFVPDTRWRMWVRDMSLRASAWPVVGPIIGRQVGLRPAS